MAFTINNMKIKLDTFDLSIYYRGEDKKLHLFHIPCPLNLNQDDVEDCRNQLIGELKHLNESYLKPVLAVVNGGKA